MSFTCFAFFLFIGFIGPYMAQELSMRDAYPMGLLLALPSLSNIFAAQCGDLLPITVILGQKH